MKTSTQAILAGLTIGILTFAGTATAHGPGAQFTATGSATWLGGTLDATLIFYGQQSAQGVGSAYLEFYHPDTGTLVHAMQMQVVENTQSVIVDGCWFIVQPYSMVASASAQILNLGGVKRICSDNGFQNDEFHGAYLGVFQLDLTSVGIF